MVYKIATSPLPPVNVDRQGTTPMLLSSTEISYEHQDQRRQPLRAPSHREDQDHEELRIRRLNDPRQQLLLARVSWVEDEDVEVPHRRGRLLRSTRPSPPDWWRDGDGDGGDEDLHFHLNLYQSARSSRFG